MIDPRRKQSGLVHTVRHLAPTPHAQTAWQTGGNPRTIAARAASKQFVQAWRGPKPNLLLAISDRTPTVKWAAGLISIVLVRDCEGTPLGTTPVTEARAGARAPQADAVLLAKRTLPTIVAPRQAQRFIQCNGPSCIVLVAFARRIQPVLVAW